MRLTQQQQAEIAGQRGEERTTRRATVPALEEILYRAAAGARSRLCPGRRLYGRRRRDRAGGAGFLRAWYEAGQRRSRPDQLSDAASPYDAVRDVRDQVSRQIADLCRAAMDSAPHRQRQRILGTLFDPRQRVLSRRRQNIWRPRRRPTAKGASVVLEGTAARRFSICCARMPNAPIPAMPSC